MDSDPTLIRPDRDPLPATIAPPPEGAPRFYRRLGFEPTGQKLRLLV
jgi:hypothetical protein